jgi:predicted flap endonuclease-1-like 5' DNA nuclease
MIRMLFPMALSLSLVMLLGGCGQPASTPVAPVVSASELLEAEASSGILALEGVGPSYASKLKEAGLATVRKFYDATRTQSGRESVVRRTGIPHATVVRLAQAADLMRVPGVGAQQAELLEAVGVDSMRDLARRDARNLSDRIWSANNLGKRFAGTTPSTLTLDRWIQSARAIATKDAARG